jgi:CubicO group peptidase (beta-lactamase class C family)
MIERSLASSLLFIALFLRPGTVMAVDEFALCKLQGYPRGTPTTWHQDCNKVGSYSNPQEIFPHNAADAPGKAFALLSNTQPLMKVRYRSLDGGREQSLEEYLGTYRVTSFVVLKDDVVVLEKYQYDRKPSDLMLSQSMSKTVLALLIGIAISEGKIKDLSERVEEILPDFGESAFAKATVEDLLRMASGVRLVNSYRGDTADNWQTNPMNPDVTNVRTFLRSKKDADSEPGSRFAYNGAQTALLGLILRERVGGPLTAYLEEKLWKPMGAEGPAVWIKDKQGIEGVQGQFAALPRDYARLGYLFVNRGNINGKQVVPESWIAEMTRIRRDRPQPKGPPFYGLHVWLAQAGGGRGLFWGTNGQFVFFDPIARIVIVQTAVGKTAEYEGINHIFPIRDAIVRELAARPGL